jgi:biotin carboxyl carrier protein
VAHLNKGEKKVEYNLTVAQHPVLANVLILEKQNLTISVNLTPYDITYEIISENLIHMSVKSKNRDRHVNAYISSCPDGKIVCIHGSQYLVCDLERKEKKNKKRIDAALPDQITPPMPSVVVRISVQVGDFVVKGQSIIVVSAMKMETTLCAPFDGTVVKINCAVNDKVAPGWILAEIKKKGDSHQ